MQKKISKEVETLQLCMFEEQRARRLRCRVHALSLSLLLSIRITKGKTCVRASKGLDQRLEHGEPSHSSAIEFRWTSQSSLIEAARVFIPYGPHRWLDEQAAHRDSHVLRSYTTP
eukprot:m.267261 g.267261  ORF g.267261 m.267261 type:complete len:115 (-) comp15634_c10_seq1:701-1045(-)